MKNLLMVGTSKNWPLTMFLDENIGDGLLFVSGSKITSEICNKGITISEKRKSGSKVFNKNEYIENSFWDHEYYGGTNSKQKEKERMGYFDDTKTEIGGIDNILNKIEESELLGFKNIIIPVHFKNNENLSYFFNFFELMNKKIKEKKKGDTKYFMTIPISTRSLLEDESLDKFLNNLCRRDVAFDGYYIVYEPDLQTKLKISLNENQYLNILKILQIIKKSGKLSILGFANWDALLLYSLADIDYISIGYYENLRKFNSGKYIEDTSGGPSNPWYFSTKLLNFCNFQAIQPYIKVGNVKEIFTNNNRYSKEIMQGNIVISGATAQLHKNYIASIYELFTILKNSGNIDGRKEKMKELINNSKIYFDDLKPSGIKLNKPDNLYFHDLWKKIIETY